MSDSPEESQKHRLSKIRPHDLGQPKPLNTVLPRIKVNSLFMFHTPDEPELTRFNVNLANSGSIPANNSYVLLLGKLTKDVLTDSVVNDNIDRLKKQLNDEDKKGTSNVVDVGDGKIVTIDGVKASRDEIIEFETGKLLLYVFAVMDWRDSSLAPSQHWHLDFCGYFQSTFSFFHTCRPNNAVVVEGHIE
jgi:hypothetical protein